VECDNIGLFIFGIVKIVEVYIIFTNIFTKRYIDDKNEM